MEREGRRYSATPGSIPAPASTLSFRVSKDLQVPFERREKPKTGPGKASWPWAGEATARANQAVAGAGWIWAGMEPVWRCS